MDNNVILNEEQNTCLNMINEFLKSSNITHQPEFMLVEGYAGTGKTTVVGRAISQFLDKQILLLAPTNKAKAVLASKSPNNLACSTVHKALGLIPNLDSAELTFDHGGNPFINDYDIIIIDECSMIFDDLFDTIHDFLTDQKVILMGDSAQLPPVGQETDSKCFSIPNRFRLTQIMRQDRNSPIQQHCQKCRDVIDKINSGQKITIGTKYYKDDNSNSSLRFTKSKIDFINEAIEDFKIQIQSKRRDYVRIIAYRNKTNWSINTRIRNAIFNNPETPFIIGENLILNQPVIETNCKESNSNFSTISLFSKGLKKSVETIFDNSDEVTVMLSNKTKYSETFPIVTSTATGSDVDYFEFTIDCYELMITGTNNRRAIILAVAPEDKLYYRKRLNELADAIDNSGKRQYFRDYYYKIKETLHAPDYGYAITSHKSQGSTYEVVYIVESDINAVRKAHYKALWQSKYVASTRASKRLVIYNGKN